MGLYASQQKKSSPLTRGVNLSVGPKGQTRQPAAGRQLSRSADVHQALPLTIQWVKGGGEPWVRVSVPLQRARMLPGTLALWEAILIIKGWDRT